MLERHDLINVAREYCRTRLYYVATEVPLRKTKLKTRKEAKVDVAAFLPSQKQIRSFLCMENPNEFKERDILDDLEALRKVSNYVYLVIPYEFYSIDLKSEFFDKHNFGLFAIDENREISVELHPKMINRPEITWESLLNRLMQVYPKNAENIKNNFIKFCEIHDLKL